MISKTSSPKMTPKRKPGRPRDKARSDLQRSRILDWSAKVFAKEGFRNADVQVIADHLQLGKGTVYRYFPSKEALFLSVVDQAMQSMQSEVDRAVAGVQDPYERIACTFRVYLEFFQTHPDFVELLIQERAVFKDRKNPTYLQHLVQRVKPWQAILRELMAQGLVRPIPVEQITTVVSNLLYGTMFTNHFSGSSKPAKSQTSEMLDIICRGIFTAEGIRRGKLS